MKKVETDITKICNKRKWIQNMRKWTINLKNQIKN